jgi:3-dehydroquinate dehydratase II
VQLLVGNGANLNALAERDPELYGGMPYPELETRIYEWARALGCSVRCVQTNSEGEFIDLCHEARGWADGVVVNPGAWAHYSYAIRDALELFHVTVVEVHLSDITKREAWRRNSVIEDVVDHRIIGEGPDGYRQALEFLAQKGKVKR